MKNLLPALGLLLFTTTSNAQGVSISNPASSPDASAILDLKSTSKGLLIPRMTAAARSAIPFPASGLMIFQIDGSKGFYFFDGIGWTRISTTNAGDNLGNHLLTQNMATGNYFLSKYATGLGIKILDSGAVSIVGNNKAAGYSSGSPGERFHLDAASGFVAKGILGVGIIPATGAGERMMWHPYKAAFRAGSVGSGGTSWNDDEIGFYSTAFGYTTVSSGLASFANGYLSKAHGNYSTASGYLCVATGTGGVALGYRSTATASYSVAIGQRASANGHTGAFVFSDASTTDSTLASANNQFNSRFSGGYRLYTNSVKTVGVRLNAGGSSWATISDSTKKENYQPASGENFLDKLAGLKLGSWNYKGQDPAAFRHYGPMAQEIFAAYGKDQYGSIGCDTLLTTADMDGIMMIMLQGLEKRTSEQQATIAALQKENAMLRSQLTEIADLKADVKRLIMETKKAMASAQR